MDDILCITISERTQLTHLQSSPTLTYIAVIILNLIVQVYCRSKELDDLQADTWIKTRFLYGPVKSSCSGASILSVGL
jgi:hypothetical protein